MKTINKIALAIIAMLLISSFSKAQLLFYAPHKTVYEVKTDMQKYFDDQVKKIWEDDS